MNIEEYCDARLPEFYKEDVKELIDKKADISEILILIDKIIFYAKYSAVSMIENRISNMAWDNYAKKDKVLFFDMYENIKAIYREIKQKPTVWK